MKVRLCNLVPSIEDTVASLKERGVVHEVAESSIEKPWAAIVAMGDGTIEAYRTRMVSDME